MRFGRAGLPAARPGFTLVELMLVTTMLGILALITASAVGGARERAMTAAAKSDLRNAAMAVERFQAITGQWPLTVAELQEAGFRSSRDVRFCRYEFNPVGGGNGARVLMEVSHRGSETRVVTEHPTWGGRMEELTGGECAGVDSNPEVEPDPGGGPPRQPPGRRLGRLRDLFGG